jgi:hypothetical protein
MKYEGDTEVRSLGNRQFPVPESSHTIVALRHATSVTKPCKTCGDPIEFNRRTAREWGKVQYCSAVCRRNRRISERVQEDEFCA